MKKIYLRKNKRFTEGQCFPKDLKMQMIYENVERYETLKMLLGIALVTINMVK